MYTVQFARCSKSAYLFVLLFANTNIFCQNKYFSSHLERGRGVGAAVSYVTAIGSMSLADRCEEL